MEADRATSIQQACELVSAGDLIGASQLLANEYPFTPVQSNNRNYTPNGQAVGGEKFLFNLLSAIGWLCLLFVVTT